MNVNIYSKGDQVRVFNAFTEADGTAKDPSTVTFKVKDPTGVVVTLVFGTDAAVVKDSTGNYHTLVDADLSGIYYYRWQGSGLIGKSAGEGEFEVAQSVF